MIVRTTRKDKNMRKLNFAMGALIGAGVGAAAGMITAPKSGKELRKDLKDSFKEVRSEVMEKISKIKHLTQEKYQSTVANIVAGYEKAKRITPAQAKEICDVLDESYERVLKAAEKGKK